MRIALVTLDYPPERGGVARYLGNLVLASQGAIDVFVNEKHQASGPGRVTSVPLVRTPWPQWWPMVSFINGLRSKGYGLVLVSHALPVGTAAWISRLIGGPKYVVLVHGLDLRLALSSSRKGWLFRQVLKRAALVLANSQFVAEEIRAFAPSVHAHVLTPGVEPIDFPDREASRRSLGVPAEAFVLLSVTRLVTRKGIDKTIEALEKLPQSVHLVVVGDGEDRDRLEHLTADLGLQSRVTILPQATDRERNAWYAAADLFILPVRDEGRDVEGFGIVYLEAALAGLPVIAGRSGGAPEAVADGKTGRLVDPESPEDIAHVVRTLFEDLALRKAMGQAGQTRAQSEFRWEDRWSTLKAWLT